MNEYINTFCRHNIVEVKIRSDCQYECYINGVVWGVDKHPIEAIYVAVMECQNNSNPSLAKYDTSDRLTALLYKYESLQRRIFSTKFGVKIEFLHNLGVMSQIIDEIQAYTLEAMDKKTLHLVVTKRWYDMINTGGKREEYRNISDFWMNRLICKSEAHKIKSPCVLKPKYEWDDVMFHLGYVKEGIRFKFEGIEIKSPKKEWFPHETITTDFDQWASQNLFFTIKIGERYEE